MSCRMRLCASVSFVAWLGIAATSFAAVGTEAPGWRPIGPWGGTAARLVADPHEPGRVWALEPATGVYVSDDGGARWQRRSEGLSNRYGEAGFADLVVDPVTPGVLYVAADRRYGILRSRDAGATWSSFSDGLPWHDNGALPGDVVALAADSAQPGAIVALLSVGELYALAPGSDRWVHRNLQTLGSGPGRVAFDPWHPGRLYVAQGSMWVSFDRGATFTKTAFSNATFQALAVLGPDGRAWVAVGGRVYSSLGSGLQWGLREEGLDAVPGSAGLRVYGFQQDEASGDVYAVSTAGLLRWPADGSGWALANAGAKVRGDLVAVGFLLRDGEVLVGDGPTRCHLADASCLPAARGFAGASMTSVAVEPAAPHRVLATPYGEASVYRWASLDGDPEEIGPVEAWSGPVWLVTGAEGAIYAATETSLYVTRDGGDHWDALTPPPFGALWHHEHAVLATSATEAGLVFAGGDQGLARSWDGGRTWTPVTGPTAAVAVDTRRPSVVYAAGAAFWRSEDGGTTWAQAAWGTHSYGAVALAVAPWDSRTVFLGTNGDGVLVSRDGGRSFQWGSGPPLWWVADVLADPFRIGEVTVLGLDSGVMASSDQGGTWAGRNEGLTPVGLCLDLAVAWTSATTRRSAVATSAGVFVLDQDLAEPPRARRRLGSTPAAPTAHEPPARRLGPPGGP